MRKFIQHDTASFSRRSFITAITAGLFAVAVHPLIVPASAANAATASGGQKMLIVYYSRSGNTRVVAEKIHATLDGSIVELQTVHPYPEEYRATTEQAQKELKANYFPLLKTTVDDISPYDVILVGSPNWWGTFASPVRGFLAQHDFSGKKIAPFITHEGSALGKSVADLKTLCPGATILDGLAVRGGRVQNSQTEIGQWLKRLDLGK